MDFALSSKKLTLSAKLNRLPWFMVMLIVMLACVGGIALYAAANGNFERWAEPQLTRFAALSVGMIIVALIHLKYWYFLSYPLWVVGMILLLAVEIMGQTGMGAQRWINLGFMNLQPSELMKIAVIMALARYYHDIGVDGARRYKTLFWPLIFMGMPMALVMLQPDLGTALMIGMGGTAVLFLAGVRLRLFIGGGLVMAAAIPLAYNYILQDYQRKRVDTFLDPSSDPMGAGYHVTQSKIAIGSGGVEGKGFLQGTQAKLNFLPEKHTDFIFTLWAEEQGMLGCLLIMGVYLATFALGFIYAFQARYTYARLLILGLVMNLSLYVLINTGMVMGVLPVVGVPLPLISYGGSAMMAALICYGLIMSARIHKNEAMPKGSEF